MVSASGNTTNFQAHKDHDRNLNFKEESPKAKSKAYTLRAKRIAAIYLDTVPA